MKLKILIGLILKVIEMYKEFIFNFLILNIFVNTELKRIGINKDNQSYITKTNSGEKKEFILNGEYLNGIFRLLLT
jgi:hypothetical protein